MKGTWKDKGGEGVCEHKFSADRSVFEHRWRFANELVLSHTGLATRIEK